jgi:hypothetical protein
MGLTDFKGDFAGIELAVWRLSGVMRAHFSDLRWRHLRVARFKYEQQLQSAHRFSMIDFSDQLGRRYGYSFCAAWGCEDLK